jgi:hypothetical protein
MYLIKGRNSEGEAYHVFVEADPTADVPAGCRVVNGVKLTAHPPSDDPDAPTLRVVLYRDPVVTTEYHYLLAPSKAKHLKRVGGSPFVYDTWQEFARVHPAVAAEMGG